MRIFIILTIIFASLVAKDLNIYLMNPETPKGFKLYMPILNKNIGNDSLIIDVRNGKVFYRGKSKNIERKLKHLFKAKKLDNWDLAYAFKSVHNSILPNSYSGINLYIINSIFYKNKNIDFINGTPSDAFLVSNNSPFKYIDDFKNFPIKTYILNHRKYFLNSEHEQGLKRFYTLFCNKYHLNLQTFNSSFNTKKEQLKSYKIDEGQRELKTFTKPPKKVHFDKDSISISHNPNNGNLEGYIENRQRANSKLSVYLNGEEYQVNCDKKGYCPFHLELKLGKNTFKFTQIDNSQYIKEFTSKYIPNDKIKSILYTTNHGDFLILKSIHTDRPKGSKVILKYEELDKEYKTKVDNDGYYEFKIPLTYPQNHFILNEYNGNKVRISVQSDTILKKEKAEAERKRREAEIARKKAEEEKKKQEAEIARKKAEAEKKRLEELKKDQIKEVKSINNNKKFQGANGDPRVNLSWNDSNDLDLYVTDPCGNKIGIRAKKTCNGHLGKSDVDANLNTIVDNPQENVTWENGGAKGSYTIKVELYQPRDGQSTSQFTLTYVNNGKTLQRKGIVRKNQDFVISFVH